ncbi:glycoside hydrolase family 13 protein [Rugosimonospora acidiphila]|uniref:Glycoside hydrolase family 13 protein n=1 Tax=Rugosimonospora acidiphila TaxID=556531 RepID=A0ABP9RPJ8_9ACTN
MPEKVSTAWWRGAAIYQVYPRSFADGNGDGVGDLAGIRARLGYLRDLGMDAIWFSPWYPSPMADAGYDVADYRDIDPAFGTLAEAEALIAEAHALGMGIIVDIVPNHCSDAHPWFQEALSAGPGSAARELFWFRPGRGENGELPPNDWSSIFGGPAWTRMPDGEWYLHLFAPEQPDLNWENSKVREEFESILRFWFDRGVDGVRIDSAALVVKDPTLADFDPDDPPVPHPYTDRDELHEVYRSWRRIADSYPDKRALIGEIWLPDTDRFAQYLRPDELHAAFNFDFLACPWDAGALRRCVDETLAAHAPVGAPATWVLSNHDVTRHVTRYGRADTSFDHATRQHQHGVPTDLALGTRRARAAALLTLALPGSVYVYEGEELGLWEVEDIPGELRQDPIFRRTGGADPGRDGCRVPVPWSGDAPPFGFSPAGADASPWLPQPAAWARYTAQAQEPDPDSMLSLYRAALHRRRDEADLGDGPMAWLPAPDSVLAFARGDDFACVVNLSGAAVELPPHREVLLASGPLDGGLLPPDTAAWLRR